MPIRPPWRSAAAWRRTRRPAAAAVAAVAFGVGGCAALETPSGTAGKNAASRTLSTEQLREVAATFEAQGREDSAERLFAAADRRDGRRPGAPPPAVPAHPDHGAPPSPIPPAPTQIAEANDDAPGRRDAAPVRLASAETPVETPGPAPEAPADDANRWAPTREHWRPITQASPVAPAPVVPVVRRVSVEAPPQRVPHNGPHPPPVALFPRDAFPDR